MYLSVCPTRQGKVQFLWKSCLFCHTFYDFVTEYPCLWAEFNGMLLLVSWFARDSEIMWQVLCIQFFHLISFITSCI